MKITIKTKVESKFKSTFVARLKFMSGDADAYETKEFKLGEAHNAERVAEFLTALMAVPHYGGDSVRRLDDEWRAIPNADVVCDFYGYKEKHPADWKPCLEWGRDVTSDGQFNACLDDWDIVYFNENGEEFTCEITA